MSYVCGFEDVAVWPLRAGDTHREFSCRTFCAERPLESIFQKEVNCDVGATDCYFETLLLRSQTSSFCFLGRRSRLLLKGIFFLQPRVKVGTRLDCYAALHFIMTHPQSSAQTMSNSPVSRALNQTGIFMPGTASCLMRRFGRKKLCNTSMVLS